MSKYKKYLTKEDFDNAKNVSIVDYCAKRGIRLDQVGPDAFQGVEHDSLKITPSVNAWYWFSQQKGGYGATSFVKDYENGGNINTPDAARLVLGQDIKPEDHYVAKPAEPFKLDKSMISKNFDKARDYLIKVRKLDPKTVDAFHKAGLVEQDKHGNVLFLWRSTDRKHPAILGASVQGTTIDHKKYGKRGTEKRVLKNSTSGWGFLFDVGKNRTPNKIVFCESCIDAMSYYDLAHANGISLQDTRVVSMEGLKPKVVGYLSQATAAQLSWEEKGRKIESVKIAVDQDEAGSNFVKKVQELQKNPVKVDHFTKSGLTLAPPLQAAQPDKKLGVKDWNELVQKRAREAEEKERGRQESRSQVQAKSQPEPAVADQIMARRRLAARRGMER